MFIQETIDSLRTLTQQNGALTRQNSQLINETAKESTINTKAEEIKQTVAKEETLNNSVAALSALIENIPSKVVATRVTDLVATENDKEYIANDYGVDGFGKVKTELRNLIKVYDAPQVSADCLDADNQWRAGALFDMSQCSSLRQMFYLNEVITNPHLDNWTFNNLTSLIQTFRVCIKMHKINVKHWDTSKVISFNGCFDRCGLQVSPRWKLDIVGWSAESVANSDGVYGVLNHQISAVGDNSIEDVITKNLCVFNGLKWSIQTWLDADDRATLRAIINGLADLTGKDAQVFNVTPHDSLTEEDIAIATSKNWTIA